MVNRTKLKGIAILVGVFLLGSLAGGAGVRALVYHQWARDLGADPAQDFEGRRIRALTRELDLAPDQRDRIRDIWLRHRDERSRLMQQARTRCGADFERHQARVQAEIRAALTAEQAARYDALLTQQRQRFPVFGPPPGHGRPRF